MKKTNHDCYHSAEYELGMLFFHKTTVFTRKIHLFFISWWQCQSYIAKCYRNENMTVDLKLCFEIMVNKQQLRFNGFSRVFESHRRVSHNFSIFTQQFQKRKETNEFVYTEICITSFAQCSSRIWFSLETV